MMRFCEMITVVTVTLGICYTIYKLVELFVHRKERLNLIEKSNPENLKTLTVELPSSGSSFSALKLGCLLIGLGMGLTIALFVNTYCDFQNRDFEFTYFSFMMLCGGIALVAAWFIEKKNAAK